jgi:hypothetical protein
MMLLQYVYGHPPFNPLPSREGRHLWSLSTNNSELFLQLYYESKNFYFHVHVEYYPTNLKITTNCRVVIKMMFKNDFASCYLRKFTLDFIKIKC